MRGDLQRYLEASVKPSYMPETIRMVWASPDKQDDSAEPLAEYLAQLGDA